MIKCYEYLKKKHEFMDIKVHTQQWEFVHKNKAVYILGLSDYTSDYIKVLLIAFCLPKGKQSILFSILCDVRSNSTLIALSGILLCFALILGVGSLML